MGYTDNYPDHGEGIDLLLWGMYEMRDDDGCGKARQRFEGIEVSIPGTLG